MTGMAGNIKINPLGVTVIVLGLIVVMYTMGIPGYFMNKNATASEINLKELLSVAIVTARRGGDKVKSIKEEHKEDPKVKGKTDEGLKDLLTQGDMESHRIMMDTLKMTYPTLNVKSEEKSEGHPSKESVSEADKHLKDVDMISSTETYSSADIAVWIDPLDATKEYTENLLKYVTTMVCVAVKGKPILGVIHKPFLDAANGGTTYWGYVGKGVSKSLHFKVADDKSKNVTVSRSHPGEINPVVQKAFGEDAKIIAAGGAGYKTLEVVQGRANAYVHITKIKKWDLCAGNAIVYSVPGGNMTTLEGTAIDYSHSGSPLNENGLLVSTSKHADYLKALRPFFEDMKKGGH